MFYCIVVSIINGWLSIIDMCWFTVEFVYEYLLHVGAQKAAQTFLNEVSLNKSKSEFSYTDAYSFCRLR